MQFLGFCFVFSILSHFTGTRAQSCQDAAATFCGLLTAYNAVTQYCYNTDPNFEWVRIQCRKTCSSCSSGGTGTSGVGASCDSAHPCPTGTTCSYQRSGIPGIKTCIAGTFSMARRPGRCPLPTESAYNSASGTTCNYNAQCPSNQKCCQLSSGIFCTTPITIPSAPTVTVIIDGLFGSPTATSRTFVGSVALAQSNGYNVLFDTAGIPNGVDVLNNLREKAGLYPEDIDQVVLSHGHSDHSANANMFKDTVTNFDTFSITGTTFAQGPFASGQTPYLLNNDQNLALLQTPGHTNQDTSLLVKNVPNFGIYALTGDLFINEGASAVPSSTSTLTASNQKIVLCQSQWILPGHGPPFQVSSTMTTNFAC